MDYRVSTTLDVKPLITGYAVDLLLDRFEEDTGVVCWYDDHQLTIRLTLKAEGATDDEFSPVGVIYDWWHDALIKLLNHVDLAPAMISECIILAAPCVELWTHTIKADDDPYDGQ